MARKWQKLAAISRKRITFPQFRRIRFVIPLAYLNNRIFRELLKMAEEEYGLPSHGRPITLPCDAVFMEYTVSLIRRRHAAKDLEKALLLSITTGRCLSSLCLQQEQSNQQLLICSF
ncbi:hypothetical protein Acr_06g0017160 [Actinidia rufa]|uniref:SAUR-like auxin-responsive protein family n=1 Tax=Actinidia rufa TaxID=165716 RepID=A0A7J0EU87_9ERIC|nr:hypothetical protein Acr_06g0017160 [Actinidia rufa]